MLGSNGRLVNVIDSYLREAGIGNPPNGYMANTAGHLQRGYVEDEVARRYERFIRTAGAEGPIVLDDVMRGISGPQPVDAPHPEVAEAEAVKAMLYIRVPVPDGAAQEIADKVRSLGGKTQPSENGYSGGENNVPSLGARFADEKSARAFERWYNEQGYTGGDDDRTLFVIAESVTALDPQPHDGGHAVVAFDSVDEAQDALSEFESIGVAAEIIGNDVLVTIDEKFGADDIDTFARFVTEGLGGKQVTFDIPTDDEKIDSKGPKVSKKVGEMGAMSLVHEDGTETTLADLLIEAVKIGPDKKDGALGKKGQLVGVSKHGTYRFGVPTAVRGSGGRKAHQFTYTPHDQVKNSKSRWYPDLNRAKAAINRHDKYLTYLSKPRKKSASAKAPAAQMHKAAPKAPKKMVNSSIVQDIEAYLAEAFKWSGTKGGYNRGMSPEGHRAQVEVRGVSVQTGRGQRYSQVKIQRKDGVVKSGGFYASSKKAKKVADRWHDMFGSREEHWKTWQAQNKKPAKKEAETNFGSRRARIASAMRKIARAQVTELEDIAAELLKEGEKKAALEVLKIAEDLDSDYDYSTTGKHAKPESKGDASKRFDREKANKPPLRLPKRRLQD